MTTFTTQWFWEWINYSSDNSRSRKPKQWVCTKIKEEQAVIQSAQLLSLSLEAPYCSHLQFGNTLGLITRTFYPLLNETWRSWIKYEGQECYTYFPPVLCFFIKAIWIHPNIIWLSQLYLSDVISHARGAAWHSLNQTYSAPVLLWLIRCLAEQVNHCCLVSVWGVRK